MSVAFVAVGAKGLGTTTCSVAHPAGTAADQILVAGRAAWEPVLTFTNEANWTAAGEDVSVGTGTAANAHLTGIRADVRELTGSLAGPTVFDFAGAGLTGSIGVMLSFSKASGTTWDVANTTGDDSTHGANRSITGVGSISLEVGDYVVVFASVDTDSALTITSPAITASGITFGTTTRHTSGAGNGAGDNGNIEAFSASVSSGSGTVAPVLTFTTSTSQCGGAVFVRLREVASGPNDGLATGSIAWVGSANGTTQRRGSASGSIAWVGSANGTRVPKGAATGSIAWVGSADGVSPVVVMDGEGIGSITWAGSANGTTVRSGAATGAISWSGAAVGAAVHSGAGSGAISWTGAATGEIDAAGAASGNITWVGSADGVAPGIGPREGEGLGSIAWVGSATGTTTRSGAATGSITWTGTAGGVSVHNGSATGSVSWVGAAEGVQTDHIPWRPDPVPFDINGGTHVRQGVAYVPYDSPI